MRSGPGDGDGEKGGGGARHSPSANMIEAESKASANLSSPTETTLCICCSETELSELSKESPMVWAAALTMTARTMKEEQEGLLECTEAHGKIRRAYTGSYFQVKYKVKVIDIYNALEVTSVGGNRRPSTRSQRCFSSVMAFTAK